MNPTGLLYLGAALIVGYLWIHGEISSAIAALTNAFAGKTAPATLTPPSVNSSATRRIVGGKFIA